VNNNDEPAILLRNDSAPGNWFVASLRGRQANRAALGAVVRLTDSEGRRQRRFISTASSYLSANDGRAHFGLGRSGTIAVLEIQWPSGRSQTLRGLRANQILEISEPQ
jgi:hypothetical protein